jgi:Fe-S-cluster-containing hydrogenase component 2
MKRLLLDLEKCDKCPECVVKCSYIFHPQNNGITSLRELAAFAVVCHRCEEAPCVDSCYHKALKKDNAGVLKRSAMLCTSCKTCSLACPFGVIFTDLLSYLGSTCDYCITKSPQCSNTCPLHALEVKEIEKESIEENIYFVSDFLAVKHSKKWHLDDSILFKKR